MRALSPAMRAEHEIRFGRYHLHPVQGLKRGRQEVRITPKSLALLRFLAGHAGQVVTKQQLFEAVWPRTVVSDAALATCIQELRQALNDDARRPRYIETVHRRGYRFLGETETTSAADVPESDLIVGRAEELRVLDAALEAALGGARQLVLVTGEAGIGKTSLTNTFIKRIGGEVNLRILRGACVEHFGAGEPYQPVLEALMRLCREPGGERFVAILRKHAPTWLAQLPALQTPAELRTLQRRTVGVTPDRMLRELTDALETMTTVSPLVLCIEDVHWSDVSTLDWIAAFARREERARILFIITYRAPVLDAPALDAVADVLRVKHLCREIALVGLDQKEVSECVMRRWPSAPQDRAAFESLARIVHEHTEGNPLFIVSVLGDLASRGLLVQHEGKWAAQAGLDAAALRFPEDLHRVLARQLERLNPRARLLLDVACIFGGRCSAAAIGAAANVPVADVETALGELARQRLFVRGAGLLEWPDGTAAMSFEFVHSLYREILAQRLAATRCAQFHRAAGLRLEGAYGKRCTEIAAELAVHFDNARDVARAIRYLQHAATIDVARSAHREAEAHVRRALTLLSAQPASRERDENEVALRIALGTSLLATRGFGAGEVEECFTLARDLCRKLRAPPQLFSAVWGLWLFYLARGPFSTCCELADELVRLAEASGDPALRLQAHHAQWATQYSAGDIAALERHAVEGVNLYEPEVLGLAAVTFGSHDACACAQSFLARALVMTGRVDVAMQALEESVAHARELGNPFSMALALVFGSFVHQTLRNHTAARDMAKQAAAVAREHSFPLQLGWALVVEGWARFGLGDREEGIAQMRAALQRIDAAGSHLYQPFLVYLMADVYLASGDYTRADACIHEAFGLVERTGDRLVLADLYRLRAAVQLAHSQSELAERSLHTALETAHAQGAKLLALRAALKLGELWSSSGRRAEAVALVQRESAALPQYLPELAQAQALIAG